MAEAPGGWQTLRRSPTLNVHIHPVETRRDLKRFVAFPYDLFRGHAQWIPPLRSDELHMLSADRNPAFAFCDVALWLAERDGRVVGRIAGIVNRRGVEITGRREARFGWVDFVDDPEVSGALFGAAEAWARERDMTAVHGPLGFTDLDPEGMLVEGFDELGTMGTLYNPAYYPVHVEGLGYAKQVDWIEFQLLVPPEGSPRLSRLRRRVEEQNGLRVVHFRSRKEVMPYGRPILQLLNASYAQLHGFVPLDDAQIDDVIARYFGFLRAEFLFVVLDAEGELAAFGLTMPSLAKALQKGRGRLFPLGWWHLLRAIRRATTLELLLVAVRPDLQGRGVNALLIDECLQVCLKHGIVHAESNPELETNERVQAQWKFFETRQHRRRRCYVKTL